MKNIVGQAITTAALFGLIGPAIGALLANLYLAWPFSGPLSGYFSGGMLLIALMSLFFGYAAGVVPAAITGATYGIVVVHYFPNRRLSYPLITFLSGAIGYCATFLSLFLYFGVSIEVGRSVGWLSLLGAASSVICALLVHVTGALPNNSFKPNPLRGSA